MSSSRRREFEMAEALASTVLAGAETRLPVNPEEIARQLGVAEIQRLDMLEDGRMTWPRGSQPVIAVNKNRPPARQRFTIAHEVAHLLLASEGEESFRKIETAHDSDEEALCDAVAAALLMPLPWVEQVVWRWRNRPIDLNLVRMISAHADVSLSAAAARITEVSGRRCALLRWQRVKTTWMCASQSAVPTAYHGRTRLTDEAHQMISAARQRQLVASDLPLLFNDDLVLAEAQFDKDRSGVTMLIRSFSRSGSQLTSSNQGLRPESDTTPVNSKHGEADATE